MKIGYLLKFLYFSPLALSLLTQPALCLSESDEEFVPNESRKRSSKTPPERNNKKARRERTPEEPQVEVQRPQPREQNQEFTLPVPIYARTDFQTWINTVFESETQGLGERTPYDYIRYKSEDDCEEKKVLGLFRHLEIAFQAYKNGLNGNRSQAAKAKRYFEAAFNIWRNRGFETMKMVIDFCYKDYAKAWKYHQSSVPFLSDVKGKFKDLENKHHQIEECYLKLIKEAAAVIPRDNDLERGEDFHLNSMLEVLPTLIDIPDRYRIFKSYLRLFDRDQIKVGYALRFGMDFIIQCFLRTNLEELKIRKGNIQRLLQTRVLAHVEEELRHNFLFHLIRFRPVEFKIVYDNLPLFFPAGEIANEGNGNEVKRRQRVLKDNVLITLDSLLDLSSEVITSAVHKLQKMQENLFDPTLEVEVRQGRVIKVIRSSPLNIYYGLGKGNAKQRAYGAAIHYYNLALLEEGADAGFLHLKKAKCFRRAGQLPEALRSIEEVERSFDSPILQLMCTLNRALIFEQQEDWDAAISQAIQANAFYEISRFEPDRKTNWQLSKFRSELDAIYGNAYFAKGMKEKAKEYYRNNLANLKSAHKETARKRLVQAYAKLCRIYFSEKNYDQVIQVTQDSGLANSMVCPQQEHALAHINLARAYEQTGQIDKAIKEYEKTLEILPSSGSLIDGMTLDQLNSKVARLRQQLGQP